MSKSKTRRSAGGESPSVITDLRFPDIEDLAQTLFLNADEGFIWLGEQRALLLYADVFGALRQELLQTAGAEYTRGLMTRMGYLSGTLDAELALKVRGSAEQLAILASGGQLRALSGMVALEPGRVEFDRSRGFLYGEFSWKHSVESEVHARISGGDYRSVCWMEVGHSSAFLTRLMGKQILVREVECRAAGGEVCRAVARPLDDWEDSASDLKYFQPRSTDHIPVRTESKPAGKNARPTHGTHTASDSHSHERIVGRSVAYHTALHKVLKAATTDATTLLLGESGVGKTMFAYEVHRNSSRAGGRFVEINCAAIPEQLMESELFGVQRGAFSGANESRPGRFEAADGGTLFLDEIGTLSMTAQSKLLRVLQSGELERLGSNRTTRVDVRVIAATNESLAEAVEQGRFRSDLYYRLNVFPILIAPLRDRKDDLPLLLESTLERLARQHRRDVAGITSQALQKLLDYHWPGNIREFENVIERAVILIEDGDMIDTQHLSGIDDATRRRTQGTISWDSAPGIGIRVPNVQTQNDDSVNIANTLESMARDALRLGALTLTDVENAFIHVALSLNDNNVTRAAAQLGLTRAQLDYRLKKLDAESS
tara:strand:+ start:73266 stop:75068 length:1803 start_codon:yes stop_codon:yes gene_type:complete